VGNKKKHGWVTVRVNAFFTSSGVWSVQEDSVSCEVSVVIGARAASE